MIENLDMDGLRAFVAIADTMSFSRAGAMIGRSQPTVSLRLRNLERALGVSLLTRRQGRVVDLTVDGRALLDYARQIIAINDSALRELGNRAGTRLRLGVPADVMDLRLAAELARVGERFPGLRVEMCTDVSAALRERCQSGDLDVVLVKDIGGDHPAGRVVRHLPLVWAGAAERAPAGELRLAAFPEGCAYRHWMIATLTAQRRDHRVVFTSPDLGAVCGMVASGMALSVLPAEVIGRRPDLRTVAGLPAPGPARLVMLAADSASPTARRIAEWLVQGVGRADAVHQVGAA